MRIGVFTPLLSSLPLEEVLKKIAKLGISTVELGTGNYPGDPHCKLSMLDSKSELAEFKRILDDHGASVSALSSHGNPLQPDVARARHDREVSRKTILLAEKLGVPVVVDFSGCPGDSAGAKYPNWVTCRYDDTFKQVFRRFHRSIENPDAKPDYPQFVDGLRQLNILDAEFASNESQGWVSVK